MKERSSGQETAVIFFLQQVSKNFSIFFENEKSTISGVSIKVGNRQSIAAWNTPNSRLPCLIFALGLSRHRQLYFEKVIEPQRSFFGLRILTS